MAAAYICGICALLLENKPDMTFKDIHSLLKVGCTSIEDIPKYIQGEGTVDIKKLTN